MNSTSLTDRAADREIEKGRADAAAEHAALEGAAAGVRDVEDRLVENDCIVRPGRRKQKLLVRVEVRVDPRVDGRTKLVEAEGRCRADGDRRGDVRGLVEQMLVAKPALKRSQ